MFFHIIRKSTNRKTGSIPVATSSRSTCPVSCPFKNNGCYAEGGKLRLHWNRVSRKKGVRFGSWWKFRGTGLSFDKFLARLKYTISKSKTNRLRLWQAGDMPGDGRTIASHNNIRKLVKSLKGIEAFGYTHYPVISGKYIENADDGYIWEHNITEREAKINRKRIKYCNDNGVAINLSGNNMKHADELASLGIAPITTTLPSDAGKSTLTPAGRPVYVCPAVLSEKITCANCGGKKGAWCARIDRNFIVGFPAHGFRSKKASIISGGKNEPD